ncbi:unnamed protein product [Orchesella dallaii]|uniref:Uncharacterized protein n=1 Tax=Orchesella dallaii TaxID=48710 RepID=A0ABP1RWW0_9HEXA
MSSTTRIKKIESGEELKNRLLKVLSSIVKRDYGNLKYKLQKRVGWEGQKDVVPPRIQFQVADRVLGMMEEARDGVLVLFENLLTYYIQTKYMGRVQKAQIQKDLKASIHKSNLKIIQLIRAWNMTRLSKMVGTWISKMEFDVLNEIDCREDCPTPEEQERWVQSITSGLDPSGQQNRIPHSNPTCERINGCLF